MYNRVTLFGISLLLTLIGFTYHFGNIQYHAYPLNSWVPAYMMVVCLLGFMITVMLGMDLYLHPATKEVTDKYGNIVTFERGWHTLWFWHMVNCRRPDGTLVYARIR